MTRLATAAAALALRLAAILVALAGAIATVGTWAVMATYPDDTPNTLGQTLSPAGVYLLPALAIAALLACTAHRLTAKRRPR